MEYLSVTFRGGREGDFDILPAFLANLGFDSFSEEEDCLLAYVPTELFHESELKTLMSDHFREGGLTYSIEQHEDKNWNAVWESNFEPVVIEGKCRVRAPFHEPDPDMPYEILIEPKMSFGTAHHETTYMMLQHLLDLNLEGKDVMDMGCGTAVLAVMAAKKGAVNIMAIDNDEWAYRNSFENVEANGFSDIQVKLGDAGDLPDYQYDVFIANINRNILLNDMHHYVKCMKNNGLLLLSGYYEEDAVHISDCAAKLNLKHERSLIRNRWTAEVYRLKT